VPSPPSTRGSWRSKPDRERGEIGFRRSQRRSTSSLLEVEAATDGRNATFCRAATPESVIFFYGAKFGSILGTSGLVDTTGIAKKRAVCLYPTCWAACMLSLMCSVAVTDHSGRAVQATGMNLTNLVTFM
jgi:hypothetical protein